MDRRRLSQIRKEQMQMGQVLIEDFIPRAFSLANLHVELLDDATVIGYLDHPKRSNSRNFLSRLEDDLSRQRARQERSIVARIVPKEDPIGTLKETQKNLRKHLRSMGMDDSEAASYFEVPDFFAFEMFIPGAIPEFMFGRGMSEISIFAMSDIMTVLKDYITYLKGEY